MLREFPIQVSRRHLGVVLITTCGNVGELPCAFVERLCLDFVRSEFFQHIRPDESNLAIAGDFDETDPARTTHPAYGVRGSFQATP